MNRLLTTDVRPTQRSVRVCWEGAIGDDWRVIGTATAAAYSPKSPHGHRLAACHVVADTLDSPVLDTWAACGTVTSHVDSHTEGNEAEVGR